MSSKKILRLELGNFPTPESELEALGEKIWQGFTKETCGTGRRIEELSGAAKFNAVLKNVGEGSMEDGFKRMCEFFYLSGALNSEFRFGKKIVLSIDDD